MELNPIIYFLAWVLLAIGGLVLNIFNLDWSYGSTAQNVILLLVMGVLQGSIFEFPLQTVVTLILGGKKRKNPKANADHLTVIMNYNLLAVSKADIDECYQTMFQGYMGNLASNVSMVLISATQDEELQLYEIEVRDHYRNLIYDELFKEGVCFANDDFQNINESRLRNVWYKYVRIPQKEFLDDHLHDICDQFAREFMLIHRISKVLRKCGQYQDFILLSNGDDKAYTYTDQELYGNLARPYDQPLFKDSEDVENIYARYFDYTLVLDADTGVPDGAVSVLMQIAAALPHKGIIQPALKLSSNENDTLFMKLEILRQKIYEPTTNAMTEFFGQCSFYGKGLIKNSIYTETIIGTRENLIERVPIDVLSHDTFEAAVLKPYYAGSVFLLEAPSFNYITWNIRERRWNRGEILLAIYFWRRSFGVVMRSLQRLIQGKDFNKTTLRTVTSLDFLTAYIAQGPLRQMFLKPILLIYFFLHIGVALKYSKAPILTVLFLVMIFPKFATCTLRNILYVFIETLASFWQFTPEAIVGCVRILRSIQANLSKKCSWVPQRAVEEEFKNTNPFISSIKHLWLYCLLSVVVAVIVIIFFPSSLLVLCMLVTLFLLPLFTGFTSLTTKLQTIKTMSSKKTKEIESFDNIEIETNYEQAWNTQTSFIPLGLYYNSSPYVNYEY